MIPKPKLNLSWGATLLVLVIFALATTPAHPQGCAQCRESIGQTPARTQQAYRHGIEVLVLAAGTLFIASIVVIRRFR